MARSVIADSGFLVALVRRDDGQHPWALELSGRFPAPWRTCEAVLSETFFLAGGAVRQKVAEALRRQAGNGGRLGDYLVALGAIEQQALDGFLKRIPAEPRDLAATRIDEIDLLSLLMRLIY